VADLATLSTKHRFRQTLFHQSFDTLNAQEELKNDSKIFWIRHWNKLHI